MNRIDHLSTEYDEEFEFSAELDELADLENPFSEEEELELAYELLEISSDEELDYFLGNLFKRASRGLKKIASKAGRVLKPLGGVLRGVAKKLLPMAAGAAGTFFGGPMGGMLGSKIGSMVSSALELELEGVPEEDKELEVARRFVRLAGHAARNALHQAARSPLPIDAAAAQKAIMSALHKHIPTAAIVGTFRAMPPASGGRWVRRGNRIVLLGA